MTFFHQMMLDSGWTVGTSFVWQSHLTCVHRENFLVLDIFFEALNYETIEQKKAYDVAGLLGMICVTVSSLFWFRLNHTAAVLRDF